MARVISGIGVGTATVIIPMFSAEMAPKKIRGQLGSMFQFFFTIGVCVSYWVNYGVSVGIPSSTRQWQVPIGLQLVPGGLLGLGMLYLPESVRWLAKRGDHEKAMKSLIWVRGGDSEAVREEMTEILAGLEAEARATEGFTWKEMLLPANRYRLFIAISLQIGVQLTGNTSLAYYAPEVFALAGAGNAKLLVSGFFGVIKVVSCGLFLIFLVDRIGRRWALIGGAFAMGSLMLIVAILTVLFPPSKTATSITPSGAASIAMIFLEAGAYNMSFGPVSWLYMSEIFPNRVREVGIAAGTATQWLFNFVFSQATPHAVNNLGWKTFLMFCIFNYALVAYGWFFIKEVRARLLTALECHLTLDRLRASRSRRWRTSLARSRRKSRRPISNMPRRRLCRWRPRLDRLGRQGVMVHLAERREARLIPGPHVDDTVFTSM